MEISGSLKAILESKGSHVFSVSPQAAVYEALQLMAEHDIGALAVLDGGQIAGVFSERDYARKIALEGKSSKETPVSEVMTSRPICVSPNERIDECMRLMTKMRMRHVLVVENGRLAGMISIGDLVNWTISAQKEVLGQLSSYISGSYPS